MAIRVSVTSREFQTILAELRTQLQNELPGTNDFLQSNTGRFFAGLFAAIADMVGFNIDRQAAESFIDTLETRPSLLSLLKQIGFQPSNPIPEQTMVTFQPTTSPVTSISIPQYTPLMASIPKIPWVTA